MATNQENLPVEVSAYQKDDAQTDYFTLKIYTEAMPSGREAFCFELFQYSSNLPSSDMELYTLVDKISNPEL